jgi:hypothetical protein
MSRDTLEKRIRALLVFFMVALVLSGLSVILLEWGSTLLVQWFGNRTWFAAVWPAMSGWLELVPVHAPQASHQAGRFRPIGRLQARTGCPYVWLALALSENEGLVLSRVDGSAG